MSKPDYLNLDKNHQWFRYKYLDFCDGSLCVIQDGTLKYTHPQDFNDPFESEFAFDLKSIDDLPKRRPDLLQKVGNAQSLSPAQRIQKKKQWLHRARRSITTGQYTRTILDNMGIVSLSRDPTSSLMWSHYADCHKGFVVEFELNSTRSTEDLLQAMTPLKVNYSKTRPILQWGDTNNSEQYVLTKSVDWSYEQEERILDLKKGPGIHAYSRKDFLSSVIAGARMSDDDFNKLKDIVDQASMEIGREIKLHRAKLCDRTYKVIIPSHPVEQVSC